MIPERTAAKIRVGGRLSREALLALDREASLTELGALAHARRLAAADPRTVTYIVDRNINYTNVCVSGCRFCAFFRPPGHPEGYVLDRKTLGEKIREAQTLGAVQVLLQGGLNPELRLPFFEEMLRYMRDRFGIHVHGFSPPEIVHLAKCEGLPVENVLRRLKDAGLGSIPGGGAEILSDRVRAAVSPGKCTAEEWLQVMRAAHGLGLRTTATMMFGVGETAEERVEHLLCIRALQDETGGFTAFIPWTFQPGNTDLAGRPSPGGHAYLRMVALARLALDNVRNVQVSWVTQGARIAQAALLFGGNDFGSTMIEENVVAAAGVSFRMEEAEIRRLIRAAGFTPARRNQAYERLEPKEAP